MMREYAKISPKFWISLQGRQIKKLGIEAQLIALYLMTNPHTNMLGVYYLPVTSIAHETGLSLEKSLETLQQLCEMGFCSYDETLEYVWVHEMALEQIGGPLKSNDNRVKAINDLYDSLPDLSFLSHFINKYSPLFFIQAKEILASPFEAPSEALRSQEQEKEQEKEKEISMSGKPDVDPLKTSFFEKNKSQNTLLKSQALEILEFLNEKTNRCYRPVETNLKMIMSRLKTGATVMDCRQIIAKKTREWIGNPEMDKYLRPETLFRPKKFESYIGELFKSEEKPHDKQ